MEIDLDKINSGIVNEISFCEVVKFDDDLVKNTDIKSLENTKVNGKIYKDSSDEFVLDANLAGDMHIEDSISLDDVIYPFSIDIHENIEENLENNQNTIDILPILWQNIVLEVPLRYTKVNDYSNYSGDGWKLISEDEPRDKADNPFLELKEKFKEE